MKLADLHIHTNCKGTNGHVMGPQATAQALVDSPLDVFAITEHRVIGPHLFDVQEEIAKTNRRIEGLLGVEFDMTFEREPFHIGYIFEGRPNQANLPEPLPRDADLGTLEEYKRAYPGVAIACHPMLGQKMRFKDLENPRATRRGAIVRELIRTGLIDGVEVLNGTLLTDQNIPDGLTADTITTRQMMRAPLAAIGGSDAHEPALIGTIATGFEEDIFKAIRTAQTSAIALSPNDRVAKILSHMHPRRRQNIFYNN